MHERVSQALVVPDRGAPECLARFTLLAYLGMTPSLQARKSDFVIRQALFLLLYSARPLSLSEMRAALDFSLKYGRSQHKQEHVPVDIGHFIDMTFPGVARVKMLPTEFPSITHDGKGLWSVKQSQHVVLVDDHITKWINSLQMTDYLYFDPSSRQVGMSELCLKYISSIPNFEAMTESEIIEACAEFPFLRYALTCLPAHVAAAPRPSLETFVASDSFANPRISRAAGMLLPMAVRMNEYDMVQILVHHLDPNARERGPGSQTALMCAASMGNMSMIQLLLSLPSIQVDVHAHGQMTALHFALQHEYLEIARVLMSRGRASATVQDEHGWNALRYLFRITGSKSDYRQINHYYEMVKTVDQIMLSAGKDYQALDVTMSDLQVARQNGNGDAVDYLLTRYMPDRFRRSRGLIPRIKHSFARNKATVFC